MIPLQAHESRKGNKKGALARPLKQRRTRPGAQIGVSSGQPAFSLSAAGVRRGQDA